MIRGDNPPPANVWSPDPEDLKGSIYVMERRDGKPSGWRLEKRPHRPEERRQGVIMRTLLKIRGLLQWSAITPPSSPVPPAPARTQAHA